MARAARKKQPKKQPKQRRSSSAKGRSASKSRVAKSRAPRATGLRRAKPVTQRSAARTGAAKKRAAGKSAARKRVTAKPARKPAQKLARKPLAKPAAKRVTKPAARRPAPKRVRPRPAPRRAVPAVPPAFSVQRASADARGLLLFELARARAVVKAAIQGLTAGTALRPTAPGKWSIFEIVLHLSERDRVRLDEFERTLGGEPHSWAGMHDPEMRPVNESHLAPLRAHTWDEAVRRLDSLREELLLRLAALPAEPETIWQRGHTFGDMLWGLPDHDRHHAAQIKNARIGGAAPAED